MNSTNDMRWVNILMKKPAYANFFNGYYGRIALVDGTALAPTEFW